LITFKFFRDNARTHSPFASEFLISFMADKTNSKSSLKNDLTADLRLKFFEPIVKSLKINPEKSLASRQLRCRLFF